MRFNGEFRFWLGGVLFVLITGLAMFDDSGIVVSPDEASTQVFAEQYALNKSFSYPLKARPVAEELQGIFGPRSTVMGNGELLPVGFLGWPGLVGIVWQVFGRVGGWFLGPILVVLGLAGLRRLLLYRVSASPFAIELAVFWLMGNGELLPVGFLGWPGLVGIVWQVFGRVGGWFLGPILVVLGLAGLRRLLLYRVSASPFAIELAVFWLMWHPAVLLYSSRPFMPNLGFISLVAIGLWGMSRADSPMGVGRRFGFGVLGGVAGGLALAVRTLEGWWLVPFIAGAGWAFGLGKRAWAGWLVGVILSVGLLGFWQTQTYGLPFLNGYIYGRFANEQELPLLLEDGDSESLKDKPETGEDKPATGEDKPAAVELVDEAMLIDDERLDLRPDPVRLISLPFKFSERAIIWNSGYYLFGLYWWAMLPVLLGVVYGLNRLRIQYWLEKSWRENLTRSRIRQMFKEVAKIDYWYFFSTVLISTGLILFYGSWRLSDNPDPNAISLADSHVRYWTPILYLLVPVVAYGFDWALRERSRLLNWVFGLGYGLMIVGNFWLVIYGADGWQVGARVRAESIEKRELILGATETESLIVVDRADKYLWPAREVIQPLREESTYQALPILVRGGEAVYYFGITFPAVDFDYLLNTKLPPLGLGIELVLTVGEESLYRFTALDPNRFQEPIE